MKTIILGPPGTGKTTTLLNLVDEFIKQGVRPKEIGYFTFSYCSFNNLYFKNQLIPIIRSVALDI